MAKEILFKAKRIDNGEWVKGYLVKCRTSEEEGYAIKDTVYHVNDGIINLIPCVVEESTICQYTGLKDRNGRKIFENDVVSLKFRDGRIGSVEKEYKYVVRYDEQEASYELEGNLDLLGHPCFIQSNQYMFEVIGNIFDMGKEDFENGC